MRFIGLLVFGDTLADGAKEVVSSLQLAKFSLKMCTGDDLDTAVYIARQAGILPETTNSHSNRLVRARLSPDSFLIFLPI